MPVEFDARAMREALVRMQDQMDALAWSFKYVRTQKESTMRVTTLDQIQGLPAEDVILVKQIGSEDKIAWKSTGQGGFTCDGATLAAADFASSVMNGNVSLPTPPLKVGDLYLDENRYVVKVVGREGDNFVIGRCGALGYARDVTWVYADEPGVRWVSVNVAALSRKQVEGLRLAQSLWMLDRDQRRLRMCVAAGVLPTEVTYRVTVRVAVDDGATSEAEVSAVSRWGCGCEVVDDDMVYDALARLDRHAVRRWETVSCVPEDGSPSPVHGVTPVDVDEEPF